MPLLNKCADIFFGYTPRQKLITTGPGNFAFLQPRDINSVTNSFDLDDTAWINGNIAHKYVLIKEDVLVLCKGKNTPIIVFDSDLPNVVSSSAFVIIRTISNKLNPYYLAWYLQQADMQAYFLSWKAGTTVLNLPIKAIQEAQVPVPAIKDQDILGALYRDKIRLRSIQQQLIEKESLLMDMNLLQFIKQQTS